MKMDRGDDWKEVRKRILKRDVNCVRCGKKATIVHHIVQWEKTHNNSDINLVGLCKKCHGTEHNYMKRMYKSSPAIRKHLREMVSKHD